MLVRLANEGQELDSFLVRHRSVAAPAEMSRPTFADPWHEMRRLRGIKIGSSAVKACESDRLGGEIIFGSVTADDHRDRLFVELAILHEREHVGVPGE